MSIQTTPPVQAPPMGFPPRFSGPPGMGPAQASLPGPPTMPGGMQPGGQVMGQPGMPGGGPTKMPQGELWIETKTSEGKSYFYHAVSRQTTWNRPSGPGIQVMTQQEIENMSKAQQMQPKTGQPPMQAP